MERGSTQGVQFLVQIILARLLLPEQFGIVAIVMVFINLAQVFVQSGFNTALIQKKEANSLDFSSTFYLSFGVAGILYLIIYVSAPYIANFYGDKIYVSLLRVLSIALFPGAFNSIQNAYVSKNLIFKKLFISSLGAITISGILGIVAAYKGLGIWALVLQQITNQIVISFIMFFTVSWRPKLEFSFSRVKLLFSFGWKLVVSALLNILYMEIRTLIIGKIYSPSTLGFYNRGELFPKVIVNNLDGSIQSVMLPTLSSQQHDKERVKGMMRRAIKTSSFLIFPMMIGMVAVAEPLVEIVLTDKWIPAVPFLKMFCLSYALVPIHAANLQAINAIGRSDIFLKLELIKKILGTIVLIISIPFGVYAIALGQVLYGIASSFVNAYPNKELLNYGYKEQLKDIMPSLFISLAMGIFVYIIKYLRISLWGNLILQLIFGVVVYIILSKIFRVESFEYLIKSIKILLNKKTEKKNTD
jgi:O-antigen/teichoic acid export membrane protein